jgi:acyl-homoserine-lactone acylase
MRILFLSVCIFLQQFATAQSSAEPLIRTDKITIARDTYGVPHIFAPTDPEVAYGLAWAHAEDDFTTIQTLILTGKGKLAT